MAIKIEITDNYFVITDTVDSSNSPLPYPAQKVRYWIYNSVVHFQYMDKHEYYVEYNFSDLIDKDEIAWTDEAVLEAWLKKNTGSFNYIDVFVQDQHSPVIIAYMSLLEEETTLTITVAIGDYDITVDDATGFTIGKYVSIFNVAANRFYLGTILSASGNPVSLDTPMDFAYPSGSFVTAGITNMNVDGSTTPVMFGLRNTDIAIGTSVDITRLVFIFLTATAVDLSLFGDIVALTNGLVLRKKDDIYRNIFNIKTNGDLANIMFDFNAQTATNPAQGQDGFVGRMTFAGNNKMGVTVRLEPGEDLQIIIQDDLTALTSLSIIAEGHEVVD